ncbi:hypothetical protein SCALM49S_03541 [Streptomyces californicus]
MDFYNPYHPHYARWQAERPQEADALVRPDGDLWWEQAQDYALSRGYNILLESAAVSPAEFEDICRRIQDAPRPPGAAPYRIEAAFVAVAGPISEFGTRNRFVHELRELGHGAWSTGRSTTPPWTACCAARPRSSGRVWETSASSCAVTGAPCTPGPSPPGCR